MSKMTTESFVGELDGGIFEQKLIAALKDAGMKTVQHGKQAKVCLELTFKQIGTSSQVAVMHKLKSDIPTSKGKVIEEDTTETPMYVCAGGELSVFPDNQIDWVGKEMKQEA